MRHPLKLEKSLENRKELNALRVLSLKKDLIDFSSNDYLGFADSNAIYKNTFSVLKEYQLEQNGSKGSRLLNGNNTLFMATEDFLAKIHNTEASLIFNSGYDANIGFFSSVPQRGDVILYDELVHASIRDGIKMSNASAYKFRHNDLEDLHKRIKKLAKEGNEIFIVTESVFSMDGDVADLKGIAGLSENYGCFLVVDEAHALGVFGDKGNGLVQQEGLQEKVFARIITFGKALGCHGAAIFGSEKLKEYLVNFARSFIYTTALPPHAVAGILAAYQYLQSVETQDNQIIKLRKNISLFKAEILNYELENYFIPSNSSIHCCVIPGNAEVKTVAEKLQEKGFDVKAILSPTVARGRERLRICIHSRNTEKEIESLVKLMANFLK